MKFFGTSRTRRAGAAAVLAAIVVGVGGCSLNPQEIPLPGGTQ